MGLRGPKPRPFRDRLEESVTKSLNGCWEWNRSRTKFGYGKFATAHAKWTNAHHIAYEIYKGQVPPGELVRHTCDNPPCCNPEHLILGTIADNSRDMVERGRSNTGTKHHNATLTDEMVKEIRDKWATGNYTQVVLGAEYSISNKQISKIVNRQRWVHI